MFDGSIVRIIDLAFIYFQLLFFVQGRPIL